MKIVLSSMVAAILASSSAYATTQFGNKTIIGQELKSGENAIYINSNQINASDIKRIRKKLNKGYTLIIDNTGAYDANTAKGNTRNILGVGLASPIVLARIVNGQLDFETINVDGDDSAPYQNVLSSSALLFQRLIRQVRRCHRIPNANSPAH